MVSGGSELVKSINLKIGDLDKDGIFYVYVGDVGYPMTEDRLREIAASRNPDLGHLISNLLISIVLDSQSITHASIKAAADVRSLKVFG